MDGLEKIIAKIHDDGLKNCQAVLDNAAKEAKAIMDNTADKADEQCKSIAAEAEAKREKILELSASRADQITRQATLSVRVKAINTVIDDAIAALDGLECEKYFDVLLTLLQKNLQPGECVLMLNQRDLARMPAGFIPKAVAAAEKAGAKLTADDKAVSVPNGFILKYGDIEINCSFPAITDDMRDELKEKANSILFKEGE